MTRLILVALLCCGLAGPLLAEDDAEKQRQKQDDRIENLAEKLGRRMFTYPDLTGEQKQLHGLAAALLERVKQARDDRYRFDRLARATDSLLEASESILSSRREEDNDPDDREEAARDLERDYFRVQQAEYFAERSGESNSRVYVKLSRSLYQQARRAYDAGLFDRAEDLSDAAGDVSRAIEYLAQAAIRVREPPRLQ